MDLLISEGGKLIPVEIKSAATFSTDFVKGLERFAALGIDRVTDGTVLYNGEQQFQVRNTRTLNPLQVENLWAKLISQADD